MEKIFEVRRCYNDITFIDEFFTEEFCDEQGLFTYRYMDQRQRWEVISRSARKVKHVLLGQLTNLGNPIISVLDANHMNRGELLLGHRHEGSDLRLDWARDTLENLVRIWRRPVRLATELKGKVVHLRYDGTDHSILDQGASEEDSGEE
jgi:stage V sporulation protein R